MNVVRDFCRNDIFFVRIMNYVDASTASDEVMLDMTHSVLAMANLSNILTFVVSSVSFQ